MLCQVAEKRYIPKLLFIGKLSECWRGHFMLLDWRSLSPSLRACCILSTCSCIFFDFKGNSTIELVILSIQILQTWPFGYCQSFCFFVAQSCWDWPGKLASVLRPRLEFKTLRSLRQPKGISVFPSSGESAPFFFFFLRSLIRRPAGGCSIVTNMP